MNIYQYFREYGHTYFANEEIAGKILSAVERVMSETVSEHFIKFFDETIDIENAGFLKQSNVLHIMNVAFYSNELELFFEIVNDNGDKLEVSMCLIDVDDIEKYRAR